MQDVSAEEGQQVVQRGLVADVVGQPQAVIPHGAGLQLPRKLLDGPIQHKGRLQMGAVHQVVAGFWMLLEPWA